MELIEKLSNLRYLGALTGEEYDTLLEGQKALASTQPVENRYKTVFDDFYEEVTDNFDFTRVQKVMEFLDWKWAEYNGVPTSGQIREFATKLIFEGYDSVKDFTPEKRAEYGYYWRVSTGGFTFEVFFDDKKPLDDTLKLSFNLDSWQNNY